MTKGAPRGQRQCKDIDDQHVIDLADRWQRRKMIEPPVLDALIAEGVPPKLALTKIQRLVSRGFLDYGVSPRSAWPTGKRLRPVARSRIHIAVTEPPPRPPLHPCDLGRHRWAWLTNGRQACGYCGKPR